MPTISFVLGVLLILVGLLQSMSHSLFDNAPSIPISLLAAGTALVITVVIFA